MKNTLEDTIHLYDSLVALVIIIILELTAKKIWATNYGQHLVQQLTPLLANYIGKVKNIPPQEVGELSLSLFYTSIIRLIQGGIAFFYLIYTRRYRIKSIGLHIENWANSVLLIFKTSAVLMSIGIIGEAGYYLLTKRYLHQTLFNPDRIHLLRNYRFFLIYILAGGLIGPLIEEFVFRGILYNSLRSKLGVISSIIFSGVIFGFIHIIPLIKDLTFINILTYLHSVLMYIPIIPLIGGLALAYLYEQTHSIGVPFIIHALANVALVIVGIF
ncbi:MAG: CPBP family intramembrane glutamic endopeptidase [bacterium]